MSTNRRYQERHFIEVPTRVARHPLDTDPPCVEATLSNISTGGIFLSSKQDFPMASKIYMDFTIPFEDLTKLQFILSMDSLRKFTGKTVQVQASGIVIRVQKGGSGIIFDIDYKFNPI